MEVVILAICILALLVVLGLVFERINKNIAAWDSVARELNLSHHHPIKWSVGSIYGHHEGYDIHIETFTRRAGLKRTTWTRIETKARGELPGGLKIQSEALDGQGLLTGDKAFDDLFTLEGTDERAVLDLLAPKTRAALLDYRKKVGELDLDEHRMSHTQRGFLINLAEIQRILQAQNVAMDVITREAILLELPHELSKTQ